ncbi:hypothetical protein [Streptomyces sp. N50]|uniref:hypothetical protein n=1 Tax=Streptomyces sp. N50 TaxID=3081765 RepID=UPI002962438C|nr:hypothetical protein [Streptomyces sp. N50]WOX11190.1 hypothetical protein R2B38_21240 [Streptomyces sp. N50]
MPEQPDVQEPPQLPAPGTLLADSRGRVGEFRGEWCGVWSLRPVTGGTEWTVDPEDVRPATPAQRLRAETARANARSRGEVL